MGLLEDAIREHLDLKRAHGADPSEIARLEREALGPVRRDSVGAGDQPDFSAHSAHAPEGHSPIEYHDSTAPHWQQEEDFGEHHAEVPAEEPKRRGFLRRGRGQSGQEPEFEARDEPVGYEGYEQPEDDFRARHVDPTPLGGGEFGHGMAPHIESGLAAEGFHNPTPGPEEVAEHPQVGGRFEPAPAPPTEVHRVPDTDDAYAEDYYDRDGDPEDDQDEYPTPAAEEPATHVHHPILDDLPELDEPEPPEVEEDSFADQEPETLSAPEPVEPISPPPAPPAPAPSAGGPPPLRFEGPPRRPTFSSEPPRLGGSDTDAPRAPSDSGAGRRDELQRTTEFDVESVFSDEPAEEPVDEDVLEETPEFLQDTPEHDRLWFEQRPPRDFDFDG